MGYLPVVFFFFFQAEDGIRDGHVTGVQTCALPISRGITFEEAAEIARRPLYFGALMVAAGHADGSVGGAANTTAETVRARSEERRVGKECRSGRGAER